MGGTVKRGRTQTDRNKTFIFTGFEPLPHALPARYASVKPMASNVREVAVPNREYAFRYFIQSIQMFL